MTITARQTSTRIRATHNLIENLSVTLPAAVAEIHRAIDDGTDRDDDRQVREDAGIRSKGAHSDPTGDTAIARVQKHERRLGDIEDNLATLILAVGNLVELAQPWVHGTNIAPAVRCTGGRTVDEWSRPDCTEWAAETEPGSGRLRGDGLCDACRMRKHRWIKAQQEREVA